MPIKIIGAGFGRTGTLSLKKALEILGFGKCYHMLELFANKHQVVHWQDALKGRAVDWDALFEGYGAAVDFPASWYYKELMAHYPEAKVILTVRDPEAWYASASATILSIDPSPQQKLKILATVLFSKDTRDFLRIAKHNKELIDKRIFQNEVKDKEKCIAAYLKHNEEVKRLVPEDRLLVYELKEGWKPLCDFLEVPIPKTDLPRSNKKENFKELLDSVF